MVRILCAAALIPACLAAGEVAAGSPLEGVDSLSLLQHAARQRSGQAQFDFEFFVRKYGREYGSAEERHTRQQNYEGTLRRIRAHTSAHWTAGVNHLADRSLEEFGRLLGWAGHKGGRQATPPAVMELAVESQHNSSQEEELPEEFSWTKLKAMQHIRDQGECGSCWAVATATVLTAHAELAGLDSVFSPQQLVSCTPNPKHCGGSGGCDGATAELALEYALQKGLSTEEEFPYAASDKACPADLEVKDNGSSLSIVSPAALSMGLTGWSKLKTNELLPMKTALVQEGPLAVAVAATNDWMWYMGGIMDTCDKDAVLNHAVALVGYGQEDGDDGKMRYWLLQNSWTEDWGEDGFLRLLRFDDDDEQAYCGWDMKPEDGSGCDGGPKKVHVCGSCGILYDTVVPHFHKPSSLSSHKASSHTISSHKASSHTTSSHKKTSSHGISSHKKASLHATSPHKTSSHKSE